MYLLLACSLFAVYVGIERAMFYIQMDAGTAFANRFYTYIKVHQTDRARQLAADSSGGLPLILNDLLKATEALIGRLMLRCSRGFSSPAFGAVSII